MIEVVNGTLFRLHGLTRAARMRGTQLGPLSSVALLLSVANMPKTWRDQSLKDAFAFRCSAATCVGFESFSPAFLEAATARKEQFATLNLRPVKMKEGLELEAGPSCQQEPWTLLTPDSSQHISISNQYSHGTLFARGSSDITKENSSFGRADLLPVEHPIPRP